ncbi:hypothetical protein J6590_089976 [Homalodisca vitripennis]|nr:hypothetical protein J6590_089976 [Homalodisca vitripennis]
MCITHNTPTHSLITIRSPRLNTHNLVLAVLNRQLPPHLRYVYNTQHTHTLPNHNSLPSTQYCNNPSFTQPRGVGLIAQKIISCFTIHINNILQGATLFCHSLTQPRLDGSQCRQSICRTSYYDTPVNWSLPDVELVRRSPGIRADILSASSRSHIEAMQVAISPNAPSGQKPVRPDILDLGSRLFAAGLAYVALVSRVRSLDGIRIEELDCSKVTGNTPCNSEALNEMMRLRNDS